MAKVPDILYKYRPIDQYLFSMVLNKKIYLSSPSQFNDPLDCLPLIESGDFDEDYLIYDILIPLMTLNFRKTHLEYYDNYGIGNDIKSKIERVSEFKAEDTFIKDYAQDSTYGYEESDLNIKYLDRITKQLVKFFNQAYFAWQNLMKIY